MENVQVGDRPPATLIRIGEVKRLTGLSTAHRFIGKSQEESSRAQCNREAAARSLAVVRCSETGSPNASK